ncbi:hypothetical protein L1N85_10885 [Paenibacillus alkaliterrae]|uniref:hypothetical protein n=1 Tax=Paenibacillus alkaliterrae TaxID=320909 RepID=UPI001F1A1F5A|nr:hypothetical protein [Paenibacillus alkaliterrae]MCF2938941.1 hypothetical protein [Paenibacillus alkaliterrae]
MKAWDHLESQIAEFIQDLNGRGWKNEEIEQSLSNRLYWVTEAPFRGEVFNYESARFTLHQLCNIVDMLTGSDQSFVDELRGHINSLLNVGYEQEVVAAEMQRELVWSLKQSIDKGEVA